jgi:ABC-type amino acid transport substrate-binding protein
LCSSWWFVFIFYSGNDEVEAAAYDAANLLYFENAGVKLTCDGCRRGFRASKQWPGTAPRRLLRARINSAILNPIESGGAARIELRWFGNQITL